MVLELEPALESVPLMPEQCRWPPMPPLALTHRSVKSTPAMRVFHSKA